MVLDMKINSDACIPHYEGGFSSKKDFLLHPGYSHPFVGIVPFLEDSMEERKDKFYKRVRVIRG